MTKRRVVVTGLGAVTPLGVGRDALWDGILHSRHGFGPITRFDATEFPVRIAAEVKGFDPTSFVPPKEARHLDRFVQFGLVAAIEAVKDSGLVMDGVDRRRMGCIWASGIGGLEEIEKTNEVLRERGPRRISPFFIPKLMINAAAGQIAIHHGIQGVNYAVASACASGGHALGLALRTIQYGDADVMVCGGSEATITPLGVGGFCALRALSERNDDPATASRPFNKDRDGFVVGEGAGGLVLEELTYARRRGARIYAEMGGVGMTDDGHHISAPLPDGALAADAMRIALAEGGAAVEDIDYVNAHGTSTPLNDVMETRAIHAVFGAHARKLMVSSTKSQIGHLLGAAGAVGAVVSVLALDEGVVPATINYLNPDEECDLDYVPNEPRKATLRNVICNSFGFGGHNVTMLFGRVK
ncbi:MAG TPA: beta-ketoacyl-ACP synthase II [Planctomycetota bacterium]|nr:beta-ketoacyl-ACP synthase II [Planctomycetota bacterium]